MLKSLVKFVPMVLSLAFASACGDGSSGGQGGSGGDASGGNDAGGGGASGAPMGFGSIALYSQDDPPSSTVAASFAPAPDPSLCTSQVEGSCTFEDCVVVNGGAPSSYVSAGVITVTGGARDVTLTPDANGTYPIDQSNDATLFATGDLLAVASAGSDEIPPFTAEVAAPAPVVVTAPDIAAEPTIDRGSNLSVTWTGGQTGDLAVAVLTVHFNGADIDHSSQVTCVFPANSGQGTVPASLLSLLPATDAETAGSIHAATSSKKQPLPGGWLVTVAALSQTTVPGGMDASGAATLE